MNATLTTMARRVRVAICASFLLLFAGASHAQTADPGKEGLALAAKHVFELIAQAHQREAEGNLPQALGLIDRAVFASQEARDPYLMFSSQWQAGLILDRMGRSEQAIAPLREAAFHLQSLRGSADMFRETEGQVYSRLADLLLRRAQALNDGAEVQALRREAQQTIERYREAELRNYFRNDCLASSDSMPDATNLDSHAAIIYPIIFPERMEILVDIHGTLHQITVPVGAERLRQETAIFVNKLGKRTTQEFMTSSWLFYDWMIRPIAPMLEAAKIETLVFVPDGPLRMIPMATLHDGKDFLISKWAVAVVPGLRLTDVRIVKRQQDNMLIGAVSKPVQHFPGLPSVAEEVREVENLYHGTALVDEAFDRQSLSSEMKAGNYGIVHIATHAQFRENPNDTFLLSYSDKVSLDDLQQLIGSRRYSSQPVRLVTLSACQTAAGNDKAALGLAGVAVKSGAQSALASLWYINDSAASEIVEEFYRSMRGGLSKALALREAQLKLLADRRFRHPGYWGPFLVIGNWM
ncbi:MAG: CHAT domain-containing protein [Burkholderiales bacterium]|nr:CHAT domain-containing protein [Burkholderiales bacterium]